MEVRRVNCTTRQKAVGRFVHGEGNLRDAGRSRILIRREGVDDMTRVGVVQRDFERYIFVQKVLVCAVQLCRPCSSGKFEAFTAENFFRVTLDRSSPIRQAKGRSSR